MIHDGIVICDFCGSNNEEGFKYCLNCNKEVNKKFLQEDYIKNGEKIAFTIEREKTNSINLSIFENERNKLIITTKTKRRIFYVFLVIIECIVFIPSLFYLITKFPTTLYLNPVIILPIILTITFPIPLIIGFTTFKIHYINLMLNNNQELGKILLNDFSHKKKWVFINRYNKKTSLTFLNDDSGYVMDEINRFDFNINANDSLFCQATNKDHDIVLNFYSESTIAFYNKRIYYDEPVPKSFAISMNTELDNTIALFLGIVLIKKLFCLRSIQREINIKI